MDLLPTRPTSSSVPFALQLAFRVGIVLISRYPKSLGRLRIATIAIPLKWDIW